MVVTPVGMEDGGNTVAFELLASDFADITNNGHRLAWQLSNGMLEPGYFEDNNFNATRVPIPYDPTMHAVWGFARKDGFTTWTLGPVDGEQVEQASASLP